MTGLSVSSKECSIQEASYLQLKQLQQGVKLRLGDSAHDAQSLPPSSTLLAISNTFGYLAAAISPTGFVLSSLTNVRNAFIHADRNTETNLQPDWSVQTSARILFLHFAMRDKVILAVLENGQLAVWSLKSIVNGSSLEPIHTFPLPVSVVDLLPNPADRPELVAVLLSNGQVCIYNLDSKESTANFGHQLTSACWSVKGKQIVCGDASGQLKQYTPEGQEKVTVPIPSSLSSTLSVIDVRWLENDVFLATYASPGPSDPSAPIPDTPVFTITRTKTSLTYEQFTDDPALAMGTFEDRSPRRFVASVKNWSPFKHLIFSSNSASSQIVCFAQIGEEWATVDLEDTSRPSLPFSREGDDTCPFGLAVDVTAVDGLGEATANPVLLAYNNDGLLIVWMLINSTEPFAGLQKSRDVLTQEEAARTDAQPVPAPTLSNPFAPNPPASVSSKPFGTTSIPSFGSSTFGASTAFGAPAFSKPSFGSTTPFSSVPTPATSSAFGAFGSSSFGQSSFGSPSTAVPSSTTTTGSAFGTFASSGQTTGFGSSSTSGTASSPFASLSENKAGFGSFGASSSTSVPSFSFKNTGVRGSELDEDEDEKKESKVVPGLEEADVDEMEPQAKGDGSSSLNFGGFGFGSAPAPPQVKQSGTSGAAVGFGAFSNTPQPASTGFGFGSGSGAFGSTKATSGFGFGSSTAANPFGASSTSTPASAPTFSFKAAAEKAALPASTSAEVKPFTFGTSTFGTQSFTSVNSLPDGQKQQDTAVTSSPFSAFGSTMSFGAMKVKGEKDAPSSATSQAVSKEPKLEEKQATASPFAGFGSGMSFGSIKPEEKEAETSDTPVTGLSTGMSAFGSVKSAEGRKESSPFGAFASSPTPVAGSFKPGNSTFGTPKIEQSKEEEATPKDTSSMQSSEAQKPSTKSLMGFASSPPLEKALSFSQDSEDPAPLSQLEELTDDSEDAAQSDEDEEKLELYEDEDEQDLEQSEEEEGLETLAEETEAETILKKEDSTAEPETPPDHEQANKAIEAGDRRGGTESDASALHTSNRTPDSFADEKINQKETNAVTKGLFSFAPTSTTSDTNKAISSSGSTGTSSDTQKPLIDPQSSSSTGTTLFAFGKAEQTTPTEGTFLEAARREADKAKPTPFGFTPSQPSETSPKPPFSFWKAKADASPPPPIAAKPNIPASSATQTTIPKLTSAVSPAPPKPIPLAFQAPSRTLAPDRQPVKNNQALAPPSTSTPTRPASPLSQVAVPKLESTTPKSPSGETGIGGEFLKVYNLMNEELQLLQKNTAMCTDFINKFKRPLQPTDRFAASLDESEWAFGDLPQMAKLCQSLETDIRRIAQMGNSQNRRASELRDLALKADLKREEAARFLRAQSDPEFRKMLKVRQLGPEQVENQRNLRQNSRNVHETLDRLEDQVATLKAKIQERKSGKQSLKTPALESISRAVQNISTGVQQRLLELDVLALRMDNLRLSSSIHKNTKSRPKAKATLEETEKLHSHTRQPSAEVAQTVASALNGERAGRSLKTALLKVRSKPLLTRVTDQVDASKDLSDLKTAFSKGPITAERLPTPRRLPPSRDTTPLRPTFFRLEEDEDEEEPASPTRVPPSKGSRGRPSQTWHGVSVEEEESESGEEEEDEDYDTLQDIAEESD